MAVVYRSRQVYDNVNNDNLSVGNLEMLIVEAKHTAFVSIYKFLPDLFLAKNLFLICKTSVVIGEFRH